MSGGLKLVVLIDARLAETSKAQVDSSDVFSQACRLLTHCDVLEHISIVEVLFRLYNRWWCW